MSCITQINLPDSTKQAFVDRPSTWDSLLCPITDDVPFLSFNSNTRDTGKLSHDFSRLWSLKSIIISTI